MGCKFFTLNIVRVIGFIEKYSSWAIRAFYTSQWNNDYFYLAILKQNLKPSRCPHIVRLNDVSAPVGMPGRPGSELLVSSNPIRETKEIDALSLFHSTPPYFELNCRWEKTHSNCVEGVWNRKKCVWLI